MSLMSKEEVLGKVTELAASITEKVERQYNYSVNENIKRGILTPDEVGPHAIRVGLVAALTQMHGWDVGDLLDLCADIMEDANDHDTAAELREKAGSR